MVVKHEGKKLKPEEVKKVQKVINAPKSDIPLYLFEEEKLVKEIVLNRMKEKS